MVVNMEKILNFFGLVTKKKVEQVLKGKYKLAHDNWKQAECDGASYSEIFHHGEGVNCVRVGEALGISFKKIIYKK